MTAERDNPRESLMLKPAYTLTVCAGSARSNQLNIGGRLRQDVIDRIEQFLAIKRLA